MALFYHIGRIFLCIALTLQGLYILGVIPGQSNTALVKTMRKGLNNFQAVTHLNHPAFKTIDQNIPYITFAIGGLLVIAAVNAIRTNRTVIKLNILGLFLLTLFIGIPYDVIRGQVSPLDAANKGLYHFYSNLALLGGLFYFHSASGVTTHKPREKIN